MKRRWLPYLAVTAAGVAADLWTKSYFFNPSNQYFEGSSNLPKVTPVIPGFFNIVCRYNERFAFSLGPDSKMLVILFQLLAFSAIGYLLYNLRNGNWVVRLALSLIFAGAIGNLYDRLTLGKVRDFIDWYAGSHHWPTFNVADSFVSVGVTVLAAALLFAPKEKAGKKRGKR